MKRREIEKQLKNDLSVASHSDFSKIVERCDTSDSRSTVKERVLVTAGGEGTKRSTLKPMIFVWISLAFLLVCAVMLIMMGNNAPSSKSGGYFVIDINPSVKIAYDKDGKVTEVTPLNEDADVLLVGVDFNGKSTDEAVTLLFDKCVQLGYFSSERDNNAVMASAVSDNGERDEKMTEQIKKCFSNEFSSKKIRGVVITGVQNPTLDAEAQGYGIDSQKYGLILEYLELGGELDESEYDDISISELYKKISDKQKEIKRESIKEAQGKHDEAKNKVFTSIERIVNEIKAELQAHIEDSETQNGNSASVPAHTPDKNPETLPNAPRANEGAPEQNGDDEKYQDFIDKLDAYETELKSSKDIDCAGAVDALLKILNEIKADLQDERLASLIDESTIEIQTLLDTFSQKSNELSSLNASAEETNSARLEAFKDKGNGSDENVDDWQKSKENEIASSWYELKKQWNNERNNDLKK